MNTSLKKTLIEGVIVELVQFSMHSKKQVLYLRFIFDCCVGRPTHTKISNEYVIKICYLKTYAELVQFSIKPTFYGGIFTIYLQLLRETSYTYKDKRH